MPQTQGRPPTNYTQKESYTMISVNLNSRIVNATLVPPPSADLRYAAGFDAYFGGHSYAEMVDDNMRCGWLDAKHSGGHGYSIGVAQPVLPSTVTHFLEPEWHDAIAEEFAVNPAGIAFAIEPACLGQWAAEHGLPCLPSAYGYTVLGDIEIFITSYNDTSALWAALVQAKNDELAGDTLDYDAELEDYQEYLLDQDYWRKGQY